MLAPLAALAEEHGWATPLSPFPLSASVWAAAALRLDELLRVPQPRRVELRGDGGVPPLLATAHEVRLVRSSDRGEPPDGDLPGVGSPMSLRSSLGECCAATCHTTRMRTRTRARTHDT